MDIAQVQEALVVLGGDPNEVVWGSVDDTVPTAPSHRPVVFPTSTGEVVVGGMDRGRFAAYGRFGDGKIAAQALLRLSVAPLAAPAPRDPVQLRRAAAGLIATLEEAAARPDVTGSAVPVGGVFDHIGNESGHVLYAYGAPMSTRAVPPTDLSEPRLGYILMSPLPPSCRVRRTEPWFGQPGGAWVVELDRVIAAYCDDGTLVRFVPPGSAPATAGTTR